MWRSHPSCICSWSVLITFKSLESSKEVRPGSIEAFGYTSLWCYHKHKRCTLSFSRFAPHHGRFFRPLSPIVISVTTVRRHGVALPSISTTVFTTPKLYELTIVELRVAYTRYPTGSTDRYSPAAVIKWNLLPRTADTKAPFPFELDIITILVLLPASLGYTATKASLPSTSIPRASCSPVFVPDVEVKLRVDRKKKSSQAATHDSVFGRSRVVSLDVNRYVSQYRRRIVSAIGCACAHSSSSSSWTAMR
jgi:hypothetical protein